MNKFGWFDLNVAFFAEYSTELAFNWNMSHLIDLDVAFYMHLIRQFDSAHVKCDV